MSIKDFTDGKIKIPDEYQIYYDYPLKDYDYSDNDKMVPMIILQNLAE